MQSEILTFVKDGEEKKLFGDYGTLPPKYISGIAHAFKENETWILTLYSETGLENINGKICSADARLAMNEVNIKRLISDLSSLINLDEKKTDKAKSKKNDNKIKKETLGPILP